MYNFNDDEKETFAPEYLYLELYPITPEMAAKQNNKQEDSDDDNRGVIVIDIF